MNAVSSRLLPTVATALALVLAAPAVLDSAQAQSAQMVPTRDGIPTLAPLVEKVIPTVVNVQVKAKVSTAEGQMVDPFRFFGNPRGQLQPRELTTGGSGIIIDGGKGYILTNHHVIADATDIQITLHDRRQLVAKLVGSDEGTDIALLQIDAKGLQALPIGDSNDLRVGDYVFAVGSPFGLQKTVTLGIVSALSRANGIEEYEDFIQTDAAINPGNSGGPLVNLKGELVGVNTAIMGPAGGNVGVGFAVPTSMVKGVVAQLQEFGEVRRGRIGVAISDINPEVAANLGIDRTEGALIGSVEKGTPADQAGVRAGDVAIELDGRPLRGQADLRNRIGMMAVGTSVNLTVLRPSENNRKYTFKIAIGKAATAQLAKLPDREALEGASFASTSRGDGAAGVKVTNVEQGSPAAQIGLEVDDIVTAVNTKQVKNLEEFQTAMDGSKRSTVLHLRRGDDRRVLVVP